MDRRLREIRRYALRHRQGLPNHLFSLPGPRLGEAVVTGPGGLTAPSRPGRRDRRPVEQRLCERDPTAKQLPGSGVSLVDAPVSGDVTGAVEGKLTVMAGSSTAVLDALGPLLDRFAARIFHVGPTGMGTIAKLVNNQIFLSVGIAVQEGFVLAATAGPDAGLML
jgi:hypothetical protein